MGDVTVAGDTPKRLRVRIRDKWHTVEVEDLEANPIRVLVDGEPVEVDIDPVAAPEPPQPPEPQADIASELPDARPARLPTAIKSFHSPMPGVVVSVAVREGGQVVTGDEICVLEAMKMQQVLRSDWTGIVKAVHVQPGQQVLDGDLIIELE